MREKGGGCLNPIYFDEIMTRIFFIAEQITIILNNNLKINKNKM